MAEIRKVKNFSHQAKLAKLHTDYSGPRREKLLLALDSQQRVSLRVTLISFTSASAVPDGSELTKDATRLRRGQAGNDFETGRAGL